MSLRPPELEALAAELTRELRAAVVQQVHAPTADRVYLALRVPGRTETLLACAEPRVARLSAVLERPPNPPTPPAWQAVWRRELVGAAFRDAEALPARRLALLHFTVKAGAPRTLVLELGSPPGLALVTGEGRVLAVSRGFRAELRPGATWTPPEEAAAREAAPSRLQGDRVHLRLAHAAEGLFATEERRTREDARAAPLRARLKRLERTRLKVLEEASRGPRAEALRKEGELLTWNQARLTRGLASVTLRRWTEGGVEEAVEVPLDPRRTPAEEVAWRFHQARRLTRGVELARARLGALEQERVALEAELAALRDGPAPLATAPARAPRTPQAPLPPYREYRTPAGRVWVGRGAVHNDRLTFQVARPFHVWFHARGVPGAHVVVPLEKGAELTPEQLLDAAHLALHHSDLKGEPRGEVSYVPVKFVRRAGAPGAVTFTREKTIALRVEPDRLQRLLASTD